MDCGRAYEEIQREFSTFQPSETWSYRQSSHTHPVRTQFELHVDVLGVLKTTLELDDVWVVHDLV